MSEEFRGHLLIGLCLQCDLSPLVLGVNVSSVLEEELNDADAVVAGGQVKGRGLEERKAVKNRSQLGGSVCAAFDGRGSKRLISATSDVLRRAMLSEDEYGDAKVNEVVISSEKKQKNSSAVDTASDLI